MRRSHKIYIIFAVLIIMVAVGAFFVGRASVKKDDLDADKMPACGVRFYATIEELDDDFFHVQGLDINNINHRGRYTFSLDEDTTIWKDSLEIPLEELKVGDMIAITYYGEVYETNPAYITKVKKIELHRH